MKIEHLEYLIAIAECGSITKAAKIFYMAQPAFSTAIATLEKELGAPLFLRSRKGISLTPQGEKIVREAKTVLDYYYGWKNISISPELINEKVNCAAFELACSQFMNSIIHQLADCAPFVQLNLYQLAPEDIFQQIKSRDNAFNLALVYAQPTHPKHHSDDASIIMNTWHMEHLYEDQFQFFIGYKNPLFCQAQLTVADLQPYTFATYLNTSRFPHRHYIEALGFKKYLYLANTQQLVQHVAQTADITLLPSALIRENYYFHTNMLKAIVPMDIVPSEITLCHYILHQAANRLTPGERIVLDTIKQSYGKS